VKNYDDIIDIVTEYHHDPEDFKTGDIDCRIKQYATYTLGTVNIKDIKLDEWKVNPQLVKTIIDEIKRTGKIDPIVYDPVNKSTIDGIHRESAARLLGKSNIPAWIGDKETFDERAYQDCMSEKFPESEEWLPDEY